MLRFRFGDAKEPGSEGFVARETGKGFVGVSVTTVTSASSDGIGHGDDGPVNKVY